MERTLIKFGCFWRKISHKDGCKGVSGTAPHCTFAYVLIPVLPSLLPIDAWQAQPQTPRPGHRRTAGAGSNPQFPLVKKKPSERLPSGFGKQQYRYPLSYVVRFRVVCRTTVHYCFPLSRLNICHSQITAHTEHFLVRLRRTKARIFKIHVKFPAV